ncbi:hypothetical protein Tsubulata_046801 [Turnera subulata]|uniref:Uncharacterized protein n=1 Tax=Turnera subulata TaxID=218843 RepID=A0A9Q0FF84_9ROSI|nr:hypothetical protein Tsubulata_046801 [Turnera subulata]
MSKLIEAGRDTYYVIMDLSQAPPSDCEPGENCFKKLIGEEEEEGDPSQDVMGYHRYIDGNPDNVEKPSMENGFETFLPLFAQIGLDCFPVARAPNTKLYLVKIGNACRMRGEESMTIHFNFWATKLAPDGGRFHPTQLPTDDPRVFKVFMEVDVSPEDFIVRRSPPTLSCSDCARYGDNTLPILTQTLVNQTLLASLIL